MACCSCRIWFPLHARRHGSGRFFLPAPSALWRRVWPLPTGSSSRWCPSFRRHPPNLRFATGLQRGFPALAGRFASRCPWRLLRGPVAFPPILPLLLFPAPPPYGAGYRVHPCSMPVPGCGCCSLFACRTGQTLHALPATAWLAHNGCASPAAGEIASPARQLPAWPGW